MRIINEDVKSGYFLDDDYFDAFRYRGATEEVIENALTNLNPISRAKIDNAVRTDKNFKTAFANSIEKYGVKFKDNIWATFLKENNFNEIDDQHIDNISKLYPYFDNDSSYKNFASRKELSSGSFYNRDDHDFEYTVNIFDTLRNPQKSNRFFKKQPDVEELFIDGKVKDAGINGDDPDAQTIWNQVEQWQDDLENRASQEEKKIDKNTEKTITDKLKNNKLTELTSDEISLLLAALDKY